MKRTVKKESTKLRKTLKILLILATSLLICIATYGIYLMKKTEIAANSSYEELKDRESSALRDEDVQPLKDNVSILFIGIDDSEERGQGAENARSDALILATLNIKTKTVKTLSIPRDSYVYIPKVKRKDKITHAHAYGGTVATIDSIENPLTPDEINPFSVSETDDAQNIFIFCRISRAKPIGESIPNRKVDDNKYHTNND